MDRFLLLGMEALLFCAATSASAATPYPQGFLWGAAWSAHQTEGLGGGGENGDWYAFEHSSPSPIAGGATADVADDGWDRYGDDLKVAQSLGLNTIRISLAWEKIEPSPGVFSSAAIAHYRAELQAMHELGLKPMVALHHFTNPVWFAEQGGWLADTSPQAFADYATYVVSQLGDLCDLWITFNEPMIVVIMGYLKAQTPPLVADLQSSYQAAFSLARAHRMAAAAIHAAQPPVTGARDADGSLRGVGLVNSFQLYDPNDPTNANDQQAASVLADLNNWAFIRGVTGTKLEFDIPSEVPNTTSFSEPFPSNDLDPWPGAEAQAPLDWLGANYYTRYLIKYDPTNSLRADWITPPGSVADNGNVVYQAGIEAILRETAANFPGLPLLLSENGLADSADQLRPQAIRDGLASLDGAVFGSTLGPALDVRGYYHWSLIDNFEWLSGFSYRFGLVAVDFTSLQRTPRPSADIYQQEITTRGGATRLAL